MAKIRHHLLFFSYFLLLFLLSLYSYSQKDLNLTLLSWPPYQQIQNSLIQLGYFHRFLSTALFVALFLALFAFYFYFLHLGKKQKINEIEFRFLIKFTLVLLFFSYPAFSHDIFNYIFDAKTVVFYHVSPYQVKPLDFSTDPMLRFMHWVHRPSIYPPGWLALTIIPYWLGFGKFVLQLFSFKALMALCWLGTVWLLSQILGKLKPQEKIPSLIFYAFNPLVLIESLVSAHSDVVMFFLVMLAFWLFLQSPKSLIKNILAVIIFIFSIEIKYLSLVLSPVILLILYQNFRVKKIDYLLVFKISLLLTIIGFLYVILRLGIQPWYLLWILPIAAIVSSHRWVFWFTTCLSFSFLLRYLPFLLTGNWGLLFRLTKNWLTLLPPLICFFFLAAKSLLRQKPLPTVND